MSVWLDVALAATVVNAILLAALGSVWLRNYRLHGARHTLGLLVFALFLLVQNALWFYFYRFHPAFVGWYVGAGTDVQIGMMLLCGLETVALVILFRITWQ